MCFISRCSVTRWKTRAGSSAAAATCAPTTRSSCSPSKGKRLRREIRFASLPSLSAARTSADVSPCFRRTCLALSSRWRSCRWCSGRPTISWRGRWPRNRIWRIPWKLATRKPLRRFGTAWMCWERADLLQRSGSVLKVKISQLYRTVLFSHNSLGDRNRKYVAMYAFCLQYLSICRFSQ